MTTCADCVIIFTESGVNTMLKILFDVDLTLEGQRCALSYLEDCLPPFRNYDNYGDASEYCKSHVYSDDKAPFGYSEYDILLYQRRYYICKKGEAEQFVNYLKKFVKNA